MWTYQNLQNAAEVVILGRSEKLNSSKIRRVNSKSKGSRKKENFKACVKI